MRDEKSDRSPENLIESPSVALTVERVDPSELGSVARVLAGGCCEDSVHLWAMPKSTTRMDDAIAF